MREFLDAAYAFAVDVSVSDGVSRMDVISRLEEQLAEPVPGEVSEEEMQLMHRRRVARENAAATGRLRAMMGMERGRHS